MKKIVVIIILIVNVVYGIDCVLSNSNCYNGPHYTNYGSLTSCKNPKNIALTFDDGPSDHTIEIAKALEKYGAKGTFFMVGKNMNVSYTKTRNIMKYLVDNGHQIGCHTYEHIEMTLLNHTTIKNDIMKYEELFTSLNVTGNEKVPKYFRAPFSSSTVTINKLLNKFGYIVTEWTIDSHDTDWGHVLMTYQDQFGGINASGTDMNKISVILIQHETIRASYATINYLMDWFNNTFMTNGVKFVTVAECMNDQYMYKEKYYDNKTDTSIANSKKILSTEWIVFLAIIGFIIIVSVYLVLVQVCHDD